MSKEIKLKKQIYNYFNKLGFHYVDDLKKAYAEKFGSEKAKKFIELYELYSYHDLSSKDGFITDQTDLYNHTNQDFETSMISCGCFDYDIILNSCIWALDNKDNIGSTAIDVGCGNGLITCFLAFMYPEKSFVGIDRSRASIDVALQIKDKLGLENIEFVYGDIANFDRKFSTVLSFRTLHENIGAKVRSDRYKPFDEQVEIFKELYKTHVYNLAKLADDNGTIIAFERNEFDIELLGIMIDFQDKGFAFNNKKANIIKCYEAQSVQSKFVGFVLDKKNVKYEELFNSWTEVAFAPNGCEYTEAQADYFLSKIKGNLLFGYKSYDFNGFQSVFCATYELKENPELIVVYQANAIKKGLNILPINQKTEVVNLFKNCIEQDKFNGFNVQVINGSDKIGLLN